MTTRRVYTFAFALSISCLSSTFTVSAQNSASSAAPSTAIIRSVEVHRQANGIAVDIAASAPFAPQGVRLTNPDRLVFDFPGYKLQGENRRVAAAAGPVQQVRMSLFSVNPPVTRVVVDMREPLDFKVTSSGNDVVIAIAFASSASAPAATFPSDSPNSLSRRNSSPASSSSLSSSLNSSSRSSSSPHSSAPLVPASSVVSTKAVQPVTRTALGMSKGINQRIDQPTDHPEPAVAVAFSAPYISAQSLQEKAKSLSVNDLQNLEDKAKDGDPAAETTLALAYHAAVLLKRDDAESLRLLHKAADRQYVPAEEALGLYAEKGIGMEQPAPAEAMEWFRKAALQGSLDAETNIALMYADGVGVAKDPAQAISWFRLAAEGGEAAAEYNLALVYARGEGTPQDYKESMRWLTAAAEQNVVPALMDLGAYWLRPPDGTAPDVSRAIHYYEQATTLGNDLAPAMLGNIYALGAQSKPDLTKPDLGKPDMGKPDYAQAVKWYRMSAEKGQREGEYGLGVRYAYGQGVPVDFHEARRLFTAAADQGLAQAQYNLAVMCEEGRGAAPDRACAAYYFELAAEQGHAKAQFRLGRLLAATTPAGTERVSAYKWLVLAQASIQESAPVLNDLRKAMSSEEVAQADREVDAWKVAHPQKRP